MNAVICAINSKYIHSSLAPWYLQAGVAAYCTAPVSCIVLEGTINERVTDVAERILAQKPRVLGLCSYIWNITFVYELIVAVKRQEPELIVVLGGPEVTYCAEQVLTEHPQVDYVVAGEGERPFALLLDAIAQNRPEQLPQGVCCRSAAGGILLSPPYYSMEDPPEPYSEAYLSALKGRLAYVETSRGCPFSCAFCLSGQGQPVHFFHIDRAKRDILLLANSGAQTVKFVDRTFNANPDRAMELVRFILENYGKTIPTGVCFHFEVAGDLLREDLMTALCSAPAGLFQLEIGLQSMNETTLLRVMRKTDLDKLCRNVRRLVQSNRVHIHLDLIAGLPQEDWHSFRESFDRTYDLAPHMLQLGFLKLLHGAPMRTQPETFPCTYQSDPPYTVRTTPWLTAEELERLHWAEDALDRLYNSGRFRRTLRCILNTQASAFDWYCAFGAFMQKNGTAGMSLDRYSEALLRFCQQQGCCDEKELRDVMVADRLSTDPSGRLPGFLRVPDPALAKVKRLLQQREETKRPAGVRRGVALLYARSCALYVDYVNRHPVTKEYAITEIPLKMEGCQLQIQDL